MAGLFRIWDAALLVALRKCRKVNVPTWFVVGVLTHV